MTFNNFENFANIKLAFSQAEQKKSQKDFLGAYDIYLKILSGIIFRPHLLERYKGAVLIVILSTADLTQLIGDFSRADQLFEIAVSLCQLHANWLLTYFTILERLQLALDRGLLPQAKDILRSLSPQIGNIDNIDSTSRGLIQWEKTCRWEEADDNERAILFSQLYLVMGRLSLAHGQYEKALNTLSRGLFYTQPEYPALARQNNLPMQFAIAAAYLEKGELETTQTHLTYLRTHFNEQQPIALVRWLELSGKIDLFQGQFGQALDKFQQVQTICQQLKLRRAIVRSTLNLAHILIPLNQTSLAKDYLLYALADAQILQDEELIKRTQLLLQLADARGISLVSDSLVGISVSEMHKGRQSSNLTPEEDEEEDLLFTTQSANYLALFDDRMLEFYWVLSFLGLAKANQKLTHIQQAFKDLSDSQLITIKIKILEGMLAYYYGVEYQQQDQISWAASILDEIRFSLQNLGLKPELWQVQRFLGWCFYRLNYSKEIQETLSQENNLLHTELTNTLSPKYQAMYLLNKWTADEEYLATKINELERFRKLVSKSIFLRPWRQWKLMQRIQSLLEDIDRYKDVLAKRNIESRDESVNILSPSFVLRRLLTHPRNRITLSFLVLPDRILVIRMGWLMLDFWVLSTTRLELRNIVQSWHKKIQGINGSRNLTSIPRDLSSTPENDDEFYELVIDNVAKTSKEISSQVAELLHFSSIFKGLPRRIKAITIIPDDILHGFPFATLIYKEKYLIEKYAVSISHESNHQNLPQFPSSIKDKVLLVGVSQGTDKFSPLPGVKLELEKVYQWLKNNRFGDENIYYLIDQSAQKEEILAKLPQASLLHISCHGIFEYNRPDQSGLYLISQQQKPEILSLRELSNLDLTQLHHVTLSSCWSADHFILPGRWVISLPETLWRSGVHSILGCLWEVYDQVAVEFMTRFYHHLEKLPRDQALRQTQLECIQGKLPNPQNLPLANPIFWSGFNLYGNFRKLSLLTGDKRFRL